jgi:subtilase family serine protease
VAWTLLLWITPIFCDDYGRATPHIIVEHGPYNITDIRKRAPAYAQPTPTTLKAFYNMDQSSTAGAGKTIAIIDAFAHSEAESDLNTFSAYYDLPLCTTENGCFKRVNQNGGNAYPTTTSSSWAQETSLDLQWAHAIAPAANILYIEADSDSLNDLMVAVKYASENADYILHLSLRLQVIMVHRQIIPLLHHR